MTRNSRLIGIPILTAALASCTTHPRVTPPPPGAGRSAPVVDVLRVQVREGTSLVVRDVPLEEYVAATILSEFDPASGDEGTVERMFEVQAIVSRSYAIAERGRHAREGFDLCSTSHCQLYQPARLRTSRWADLARAATERTRGEVLVYAGTVAEAFFHANCGGHTSSAADVWGGAPLPYLVGVSDADEHQNDDWTFDPEASSMREALNADARTATGKLTSIQVSRRDEAGRAEEVTIDGTRTVTVRGDVFRDVITRRFGARSLRSTLFSVSRSRTGFAFRGKGFGHGVGLCQDGALARLAGGATPEAVLAHYFPGTTVSGPGLSSGAERPR